MLLENKHSTLICAVDYLNNKAIKLISILLIRSSLDLMEFNAIECSQHYDNSIVHSPLDIVTAGTLPEESFKVLLKDVVIIPFQIFMPLVNLRFMCIKGHFPILMTSFPDLYPLISPPPRF